jgi:hypothetical protein
MNTALAFIFSQDRTCKILSPFGMKAYSDIVPHWDAIVRVINGANVGWNFLYNYCLLYIFIIFDYFYDKLNNKQYYLFIKYLLYN